MPYLWRILTCALESLTNPLQILCLKTYRNKTPKGYGFIIPKYCDDSLLILNTIPDVNQKSYTERRSVLHQKVGPRAVEPPISSIVCLNSRANQAYSSTAVGVSHRIALEFSTVLGEAMRGTDNPIRFIPSAQLLHSKAEQADELSAGIFAPVEKWQKQFQALPLQ